MIVDIENLERYYEIDNKKHYILKKINLKIKNGECLILKGVSGSGKTTLISIIAGLDKPSSGKVLVGGEAVSKLPDLHLSRFRAQKIGIIFQDFNLINTISLIDNLIAAQVPLNKSLKEAKKSAEEALQKANILHKKDKKPSELSGGEKQRGAIARALVNNPDLIICDEPTANLDRENSLNFIKTLETLHKEGKSIIVATHDPLFENLNFLHKTAEIKNGQIAS